MENEYFFNSLTGNSTDNNELRIQFSKMVERKSYAKNQIILTADQICNQMWFVMKGFAMSYIYKEDRKIPYWFWNDAEIIVATNSFFKQLPSDGYIEILEKSTLLSISYSNIMYLTEKFPEFNHILRVMLEDINYATEKRIFSLTTLSPEERYQHLLKESSFIIRKASVETIASYLGVSRKTNRFFWDIWPFWDEDPGLNFSLQLSINKSEKPT
jgi:CRP-like cAMP-binding protein